MEFIEDKLLIDNNNSRYLMAMILEEDLLVMGFSDLEIKNRLDLFHKEWDYKFHTKIIIYERDLDHGVFINTL